MSHPPVERPGGICRVPVVVGNSVRVVLPGVPRGKKVAQITRFGAFTPKETKAEMDALRMIARVAMAGRPPFTGPVSLKLAAYFPIPKSWSKADRQEAREGVYLPITKPDGSNIQKLCEDAIQPPPAPRKKGGGISYEVQRRAWEAIRVIIKDDSQITDWQGWKRYSDDPRVVIEITEIEGVKVRA